PSDVETTPDARGVGDPPYDVLTVRHGEVAALISLIDPAKRLGTAQDLTAHAALVDAVVVHAPVLPLRFGAVMAGEVAVADELLAEHHDEFVAALERIDGKAEFLIKGRYERSAVLREIVTEDQKLARSRHTPPKACGEDLPRTSGDRSTDHRRHRGQTRHG
ncbi:MAG TPA: GvpL/GvpF family gas vesicle protein, partial [Actinophytocola sp.]